MAESTGAKSVAVVLVHGGFVDGSGWEGVYKILKKDGYDVSIVQNTTISLADDVAATKRVLATRHARHSCWPFLWWSCHYGGRQRSQGRGACLYCCFCSGRGGIGGCPNQGSTTRCARAADPASGGRLSALDKTKFWQSFAADVGEDKAAFMADSQVPWGVEALSGAITRPAWKAKPSWYLVATDDKMIPPPAQHFMSKRAGSTVVEEKVVTPCTCPSQKRWQH